VLQVSKSANIISGSLHKILKENLTAATSRHIYRES
jgi:hypothetical protein